jgi:hypothetical protein
VYGVQQSGVKTDESRQLTPARGSRAGTHGLEGGGARSRAAARATGTVAPLSPSPVFGARPVPMIGPPARVARGPKSSASNLLASARRSAVRYVTLTQDSSHIDPRLNLPLPIPRGRPTVALAALTFQPPAIGVN